MSNFFKDLKIIELASVLAGPGVGMFFAELGAEVIKVENPHTGGDATRNWHLAKENKENVSAYFSSINYRKTYRFIDLKGKTGQEELKKEISDADILISNFSPLIAEKMGLRVKEVSKLNPRIIYLQLSGFFGSDRPAYDVVLQAETGWISMTGTPEHPAKLPVALIDIIAGHQLKEAALLGIVHRLQTGKGIYAEVSLEESSLSALANQASNYLMADKVAKRLGTKHPNIAPYGDLFQTSDGVQFVLAVGSEEQFGSLIELLKLKRIPNFETNNLRLNNRSELIGYLQSAFDHWEFENLAKEFDVRRIPYGKVKNLQEVLNSKTAREMTRKEMIMGTETLRLSGNAFRISPLPSADDDLIA